MIVRQLSAYLDLIRVISSVVVVLSHLGHGHLIGGVLWSFTSFGNEAVMVFFVLSGFVIAYVVDQREQVVAVYASARLARLYSVIFPAMLLTLLLDSIGQSIHPESYRDANSMKADGVVAGYLLSSVMLNQSWGMHGYFGSDGAYWSIPYEFWYYFIYGAVMLLSGWKRFIVALCGAGIAGPEILTLLPVWLFGVAAYQLLRYRNPGVLGPVIAIASLSWLFLMLWVEHSGLGLTSFIGIVPNSLSWQYLIGCCMAVHLYSVSNCIRWFQGFFACIERPLSFFSGCTMALYLFHLPVIGVIHAIERSMGKSLYTSIAMVAMPFVVSMTFGRWCELQKKSFRFLLLRTFLFIQGYFCMPVLLHAKTDK